MGLGVMELTSVLDNGYYVRVSNYTHLIRVLGHLSNGHFSNGYLSNGHLINGHLSNGHLFNGHLFNVLV